MPTPHTRAPLLILIALLACSSIAAPTATLAQSTTQPSPWPLNESIPEPGGTIHLSVPRPLATPAPEIHAWVNRAATAIVHFYGHYPVPNVTITVTPGGRGGVQGGVTRNGKRIDIRLGRGASRAVLVADWTMTHEMFHLSQPGMYDGYTWMSEGMADYLEPVARVRIGQITVDRFWRDLVEGMPEGLPQPGDQGLDGTRSWGRIYWGGSLYWLLADIRIRQQTDNRKSVRDAAGAVLEEGGDGTQTWDIDRILAAYDRAVGLTVFTELHEALGPKPVTYDLDSMWKLLGVIYEGNAKMSYDDNAPLASVRKGITEPEKPEGK